MLLSVRFARYRVAFETSRHDRFVAYVRCISDSQPINNNIQSQTFAYLRGMNNPFIYITVQLFLIFLKKILAKNN